MANPPVSRASLLAGLRTGGVRSSSGPVPYTAAPGASFNISQPPIQHNPSVFPDEDEQVVQMPSNLNSFANDHHGGNRTMPMTAAVDGSNNRFAQQQGLNNQASTFVPNFTPSGLNPLQAQAFQLQMMQLELMKIQAQNYQAEVLAQAQRQAQQPTHSQFPARQTANFNPPATAGPTSTAFDLRSATLSAQMRRANQAETLKTQNAADDQVPMTAALGGKFGSRSVSGGAFPTKYDDIPPPHIAGTTTVISGGTPLGSPAPNNLHFNNINNTNSTPSKSDSVSSWRRGSTNNSVLRTLASPSVKITPPPPDSLNDSPPSAALSTPSTATPGTAKFRPQPLRFNAAVSQPLPAVVAVDTFEVAEVDEDSSSGSSKSNNSGSNISPTSSVSSNEMPLSPREEASRKLYEGLGIGRPVSATKALDSNIKPTVIVSEPGTVAAFSVSSAYSLPMPPKVIQPLRQPRGPPSGMDELAPQNFATRIKNQALGGLNMLRSGIVAAY